MSPRDGCLSPVLRSEESDFPERTRLFRDGAAMSKSIA